jgi:hypothetical protein
MYTIKTQLTGGNSFIFIEHRVSKGLYFEGPDYPLKKADNPC